MALVLVVLLAGCASSTLYRPAPTPEAEGYRSFALTSDRYRVSFAGNSVTARETVEVYALYRAAEVALKAGYGRFKLVSQDTEAITAYQGSGIGFGGFWGGPWFGTGVSVDTAQPVTRYRSVVELVVGPQIEVGEGADIYNARELVAELSARIERPPSG